MELFSERLLACRRSRGKLQTQVATETGINYRTYCRYERGNVDVPLSAAVKLADYFGVSLDYLTGRSNDPKLH